MSATQTVKSGKLLVSAAGVLVLGLALGTEPTTFAHNLSGAGAPPNPSPATSTAASSKDETDVWIIQLEEPPLASYRGGIAGLAATSPRALGKRRLDPHSAASRSYLELLSGRHASLRGALQRALGRSAKVLHEYRAALNGLAVEMSEVEAARVRALPGVESVMRETINRLTGDASPFYTGATELWPDGSVGVGTQGEGMVVGVLDSGINPGQPVFAEVGPLDGYVHQNPLGSGVYLGECLTQGQYLPCNDKVIGAYKMASLVLYAQDGNGHGVGVASLIAGNHVDVPMSAENTESPDLVHHFSGMAPHANIISYAVCNDDGGCSSAATAAGIDQAILDGVVDVINHSITLSAPPGTARSPTPCSTRSRPESSSSRAPATTGRMTVRSSRSRPG